MNARAASITDIRNVGEHFEFRVSGWRKVWRMRDRPFYPVVKTPEWIAEYFGMLIWLIGDEQ